MLTGSGSERLRCIDWLCGFKPMTYFWLLYLLRGKMMMGRLACGRERCTLLRLLIYTLFDEFEKGRCPISLFPPLFPFSAGGRYLNRAYHQTRNA